MNIQSAKTILTHKEPAELYDLVQPALESAEVRDLLVEGYFAKDETYRYNCVQVFFRALEKQPALFYSYWNNFAGMIDSPNGFYRSTAAQAIAFLTAVDTERLLDPILDTFLGMLDDEKVMVARYFVQTIHLIPAARAELRKKVIVCLLGIEIRDTPKTARVCSKPILSAPLSTFLRARPCRNKRKSWLS